MTHSIRIAPKNKTFGHGSKTQKALIDIDRRLAGDEILAWIGASGSVKSALPGLGGGAPHAIGGGAYVYHSLIQTH